MGSEMCIRDRYNVSGNADINNAVGTLIGRNGNNGATGDGLVELTGSSITFDTGVLALGLNSSFNDTGASGELSYIADAGGVSTIISADNTRFGANADLSVDLTADANFSTFTSFTAGPLQTSLS